MRLARGPGRAAADRHEHALRRRARRASTSWVVSASPQESASVWAQGAGFPAGHTIGIRIQGAAALQPAPAARRQAIAGGDSDPDVTMVRDATGVHIAINRNKHELMWGAVDARGKEVPVIGDDGVTPIPDQQDTVLGT